MSPNWLLFKRKAYILCRKNPRRWAISRFPGRQNAVRAPSTFCTAGCLEVNEKRAKTETSITQTPIVHCRSKCKCATQIFCLSMQFYPKQEKKENEVARVLDLPFLSERGKLFDQFIEGINKPSFPSCNFFRKQCIKITPGARMRQFLACLLDWKK